jgi:glycosyltransferase involved in cell wall biosynthesis
MRVLIISKACVVGAYQRKLEEIAAYDDVELTAAVPPEWRDERGVLKLERAYTSGYRLVVEPMWLNGSFHLHFYPWLAKRMAEVRPDVVHIDEEPYNLATWHALRLARRHRARALFFSWQNLHRRYPFPFSMMEAYVLRHADYAICGNHDAEQVWRAKGYAGPAAVIPQFGVDPELFSPGPPGGAASKDGRSTHQRGAAFTIAYAGRFVPEKGVDVLIRAAATLSGDFRLRLLGSGPQENRLRRLAAECGLGDRVTFEPWMPSTEFPNFLHAVDAFVLPSVTYPHWKEQFGRVLVDAMACGVPVVGSTCGEIPNVIGEAGLIVPERSVEALAAALQTLQHDPQLRAGLGASGRARVLARFTQKQVAAETVQVYREMLGGSTAQTQTGKQVNSPAG